MTRILQVVSPNSEATYVASQKAEGGQVAKSVVRLRELGGRYTDEYACVLWGNLALCRFYAGELVAASLRFQVREVNGQMYQETTATDMLKLIQ